jgi:hypothetical protein
LPGKDFAFAEDFDDNFAVLIGADIGNFGVFKVRDERVDIVEEILEIVVFF